MTKRLHDNYGIKDIAIAEDCLKILDLLDYNQDGEVTNFPKLQWRNLTATINGKTISLQGDGIRELLEYFISSFNRTGSMGIFRDTLRTSLPWFQKHVIVEILTPPHFPQVASPPREFVLLHEMNYQEKGVSGKAIVAWPLASAIAILFGANKAAEFIVENWNGNEPFLAQLTIEGTQMAWQEPDPYWLKQLNQQL